ncbi:hypothetical protein [Devosia sp. XK-2]|uniref:hypothetical protein n=1 Tax=Devosia sp. XK-2 TaxID=3126689 RepID=UPI0030CCA422
MVDYRAESIENARGAIKGATLLNGGAAVALLTQISAIPQAIAGATLVSMVCWAAGLAVAMLAWVAAFVSTRYVDKWLDEKIDAHRVTSNRFQAIGLVLILLSIVAFLTGSVYLAWGFHAAYAGQAPTL